MLDFFKWTFSLIGHLGLWCALFNVLHGTSFSRPGRKLSEKLFVVAVVGPIGWVLLQWYGLQTVRFDAVREVSTLAWGYGLFCIALGFVLTVRWGLRRFLTRLPRETVEQTTERINLRERLGRSLLQGRLAQTLGKFPGNQVEELEIERRTWVLPELPTEFDGLRISHLSDLHFTGQLERDWFAEVVAESNRFAPDLVLLTGDIVDEAECLPWLQEILSGLEGRLGKFYVLGNHDLRIANESAIRSEMEKSGFQALQAEWVSRTIGEATLWLAGNELPWFSGAESLPARPKCGEGEFRILLSHSPDQFRWAQTHQFDLMLAGHTHGGQIRFPLIGPVIAPSAYGVRFASGTFRLGSLLMHVSRGLSGDDPIRINCPPELGLITLRRQVAV